MFCLELERRYPEFKESELPAVPQRGSSTPAAMAAVPSSAANEVLVPNKSTLVEEDVGLPASPDPRDVDPENGAGARSNGIDRDFSDKVSMGRASEASSIGTKFFGGYGHSNDRRSVRLQIPFRGEANLPFPQMDLEDVGKIRSDYEYKIATMQQRQATLEREVEDLRAEDLRCDETFPFNCRYG